MYEKMYNTDFKLTDEQIEKKVTNALKEAIKNNTCKETFDNNFMLNLDFANHYAIGLKDNKYIAMDVTGCVYKFNTFKGVSLFVVAATKITLKYEILDKLYEKIITLEKADETAI